MRFLLLIFCGLVSVLGQPVDAVEWLDNYQEALNVAKATGKPIFLEFRCEP